MDEDRLAPGDPLLAAAESNALARQEESLAYDLEDPWVDDASVQDMVSLRQATVTRSNELVGEAVRTVPRRAALLGLADSRLEDVQAVLQPGDVLVQYLVGDSTLTAFGVTSQTLASVRLPVDAEDLGGRLRIARELLGRADVPQRESAPVLDALHRILWRDVLDGLAAQGMAEVGDAERVFFVPHGPLTYLPLRRSSTRSPAGISCPTTRWWSCLRRPCCPRLPVVRILAAGARWSRGTNS